MAGSGQGSCWVTGTAALHVKGRSSPVTLAASFLPFLHPRCWVLISCSLRSAYITAKLHTQGFVVLTWNELNKYKLCALLRGTNWFKKCKTKHTYILTKTNLHSNDLLWAAGLSLSIHSRTRFVQLDFKPWKIMAYNELAERPLSSNSRSSTAVMLMPSCSKQSSLLQRMHYIQLGCKGQL